MRTAIGLILFTALLCATAFAQTDVADITAALAQADGTDVRITGKVKVIGYDKISYSDFAVQDSSGADGQTAIYVYYGSRVTCADGDTISGLIGQMTTYNGLRELSVQPSQVQTPTQHTGGDALPALVPLQLTGTEFTTNYANYGSEYIKLIGTFDSPGGTFASATNYDFTTQDSTAINVRIQYKSELISATIPSGLQEISGIGAIYTAGTPEHELWPLYSADMQPYVAPTATPTPTPITGPTAAEEWMLYE